ncbi:hypothetical protein Desku_2567 [Desulfofundulus kuznetsovii DSM 6115]|jgi:hypothetical protein|uniref:Uncharacterized protein n=1 Tax=Desulfofundulus kuznetsovii (strain DSM 6115 / VKM B-1805 / 17) TaxID=760568 RepID=A0AAU8PPG4_DESK7|nr:hypothetical protein Desku_2567 [Desulfofundulus kuznetsovii DSM 6115]
MSWPLKGNQHRNKKRPAGLPAAYRRRNIIYLFEPLQSSPLAPHPGLPPLGRWEKSLSHPFAEIEISRALRAEKDARVNRWHLLLPVLTLSIPTALCLYGFVNYFIR